MCPYCSIPCISYTYAPCVFGFVPPHIASPYRPTDKAEADLATPPSTGELHYRVHVVGLDETLPEADTRLQEEDGHRLVASLVSTSVVGAQVRTAPAGGAGGRFGAQGASLGARAGCLCVCVCALTSSSGRCAGASSAELSHGAGDGQDRKFGRSYSGTKSVIWTPLKAPQKSDEAAVPTRPRSASRGPAGPAPRVAALL